MEQKRRWIHEPFNGISHFAGAVLSIAALVVLILRAHGRPIYLVSFCIYAASLIGLYTASTLYHSLPVRLEVRKLLRRFDFIGIYLLIAGTYTPICLLPMRHALGPRLLIVEYLIAGVGIATVLRRRAGPHWINVALFLLMGWLAAPAMPSMLHALTRAEVGWIVGGGIAYTVGAVVYATQWPRLWPGKFGSHDLWHIFVLGGSACHFVCMLLISA
jgi:hemolysin III